MRSQRIAIVGMGLRYPDAETADEFWSNILAGRRAFRTLPEERISLSDYWDPDPAAPDKFYSRMAAVLRDYEFDRVNRMISTATMRSTDMTHWLALDVASEALRAAGFPNAEGLPRQRTGVILGNTLTGEFSRANVLRLRWPYVRRAVAGQLSERGWEAEEVDRFVGDLEAVYKGPFPAATEDMLAGGLANTIAGRICNYFDLGGGGFTVDGACSSSLLSVISAANALASGDLDVAIAGGVDLSIDPFELVGFAKTGALARREMVVYDEDSNGFWPGEGCGAVVLMREEDARAQGRPVLASITGWGMSSDGKGGITRPEVDGHRRAIAAAYSRAGYKASTVSYFEGHGTGTAVGDATEIAALASTRDGVEDPWPAALSSIKGNIGHTKAAAGIAGLIKATLSLQHGIIPPATSHVTPHALLTTHANAVHVPDTALAYHPGVPARAGVSAMGFGGINTHIALEGADMNAPVAAEVLAEAKAVVRTRQDAELIVLAADDIEALRGAVGAAVNTLERASMSELGDLAIHLQETVGEHAYRLALVARTPDEAVRRLRRVAEALANGEGPGRLTQIGEGTWLGHGEGQGRVAYAFPGQGAGHGVEGGFLRRFAKPSGNSSEWTGSGTDALQPRIVDSSLRALHVLTRFGLEADCAVGHSLGEITALTWAGALDPETAVEVARRRGRTMAEHVPSNGAMAVLGCDAATAELHSVGTEATVSGYNSAAHTVVAGSRASIKAVAAAATAAGVMVTQLDVRHAFHTDHCAPAMAVLATEFADVAFAPLRRPVLSPSVGGLLPPDTELAAFLSTQVTKPVRFDAATAGLAGHDLVVEVGPGRALGGLLAANIPGASVVAVDTDSASLVPALDALAAAFALGQRLDLAVLGRDRVRRPFELGQVMSFLANPCEQGFELDFATVDSENDGTAEDASTLEVLITTVAEKVGLPVEVLSTRTSPLEDLHMSSITVGQLTNDVLRALGRGPMTGVPSFATSNLGDIAEMIDQMSEQAVTDTRIAGAGPWLRIFREDVTTTTPLLAAPATGDPTPWTIVGDDPVAADLADRLAAVDGLETGVLVSTTGNGTTSAVGAVEALVQAVTSRESSGPLVVLQRGGHGAAAAARSLHLEGLATSTTVIHIPADLASTTHAERDTIANSIAADVARGRGFTELRYGPKGRELTAWTAIRAKTDGPSYLAAEDVLLVTGGGKGITAESALRIAAHSGCALALFGRSAPDHPDVEATLEQARREGIRHLYLQADITSANEVAAAVTVAEERLGPVTAVLHGAGTNEPVRAAALTRDQFHRTLSPKVHGLRTILDHLDSERLRLVLAFGSIIGRAGMAGEVHYATANDWLADEIRALRRRHPHVRARCVEWSVWSGAGMGERLGVLQTLQQQGIEPIPSEWGTALVPALIDDDSLPDVFVVAGRTGSLATVRHAVPEVPMLRFLESPRIHYAGVELVSDAELSAGTDLYLPDHVIDGQQVFPAVMGMEAMAQIAVALCPGLATGLAFENLRFERPVVIPRDGSETIRVAGLVDGDAVRVVVRSETTGFAVDHFSAVVRPADPPGAPPTVPPALGLETIDLDVSSQLYGSLMFQEGRFRKVRGYRVAAARQAVATLDAESQRNWFSFVHPQDLVLADPGARDAMMHAIQCCVPDAVLLPEGVDRLVPALAGLDVTSVDMEARERTHEGDAYGYDIACYDGGRAVECWSGLRLRAVVRRGPETFSGSPAMAGPYLQRRSERVFGLGMEVVVEPHGSGGALGRTAARAATDRALARLRPEESVYRRGDGRLVLDGTETACSSHHDRFTLAIIGPGAVACDTEGVLPRSDATWENLLGSSWPLAREISQTTGESFDAAATRVWGAMECVRKVGHAAVDLALGSADKGDVVIVAGSYRVLTFVLPTGQDETMFALLGGS